MIIKTSSSINFYLLVIVTYFSLFANIALGQINPSQQAVCRSVMSVANLGEERRIFFKKFSGDLLWRVSTRWRSSIETELKKFNLTHPQFVVLAALSWLTQDGKSVKQIEVGRMAGLDPNTLSQVIRGLEAKELVKRVVSSLDERSKNPTVTKRGKEVLAQALPAVERVDEQFFTVLQKKEQAVMGAIFQKLMRQE